MTAVAEQSHVWPSLSGILCEFCVLYVHGHKTLVQKPWPHTMMSISRKGRAFPDVFLLISEELFSQSFHRRLWFISLGPELWYVHSSDWVIGEENRMIMRLRGVRIQPLGLGSSHLSLVHIVILYLNKIRILLARKKRDTPSCTLWYICTMTSSSAI